MAKHMLIDATHPEEIRVVVVDGKRLEEFDIELASKKQLKGNIYLAKVTRVEPSLQAAFVEYGGNRHGFLAFSEIHPDYYRIPVADREALLAEEAREAAAESAREEARDAADEARAARRGGGRRRGRRAAAEPEAAEAGRSDQDADTADTAGADHDSDDEAAATEAADGEPASSGSPSDDTAPDAGDPWAAQPLEAAPDRLASTETFDADQPDDEAEAGGDAAAPTAPAAAGDESIGSDGTDAQHPDSPEQDGAPPASGDLADGAAAARPVEVIGGDEIEEVQPRRSARHLRSYKIQEVIKRRQVMLVQVTKEERGTKGAALTTYLSLAGRYCVLMPNTARGGGVSRKISNPADRKRLKSILEELDIPEGMAVIIRTAGAERSKAELKRDYEYLLRLWDEIRELTLKSSAPALVYEEANLIKRSIRDLYSRDIEDVIVDGDEGYKVAKAFMRTLTPSHAKRVQLYRDPMPLFHRHQVESQLDAIHNPVVQLRSGGYIVINSTEALVAIDVNSGRATRERNIEETAHKTNLEAAEEIARQLRLRDLAGLIVIDFIDMEESRHNAAVERRLKESMRSDRARIQIGRISAFGLLELSRQRMRPSLFETSTEVCEHCRGTGHVRSTESTVLHVLRSIEDECLKSRNAEGLSVVVPTPVALYILNHKRKALAEIELRHGLRIFLAGDDHLIPPEYRVERLKALAPGEQVRPPVIQATAAPAPDEEEDEDENAAEESLADESTETERAETARDDGENAADDRRRPRRRRRGKGERGQDRENGRGAGRGRDDAVLETPAGVGAEVEGRAFPADADDEDAAEAAAGGDESSEESRRRRRRGRRGGRRRRRGGDEARQAGTAAGEADDANGHSPSTDGTAGAETTAESVSREPDGDRGDGRRGDPADAEANAPDAPEAPRGDESGATTPDAVAASDPESVSDPAPEPPVEQRWTPQPVTVSEPPVIPAPEPAAVETSAPSAADAPAEAASEPAAPAPAEHHQAEAPEPATATEDEPEAETPAAPRRRGWWRRLAE